MKHIFAFFFLPEDMTLKFQPGYQKVFFSIACQRQEFISIAEVEVKFDGYLIKVKADNMLRNIPQHHIFRK